jgi:hypothetical protein
MAVQMKVLLLTSVVGGASSFAFLPQHAGRMETTSSASSSSLKMSMKPVYDNLVNQVNGQLGLQSTDFTSVYETQSWADGGSSGTAEWLAEASPQFLTGVNQCTRMNNGKEELTLNVWVGPSYDVPHMLLTFGEESAGSGRYHLMADYVPRGMTPIGSDPQYMEAYYGADVSDACARLAGSPGAAPLAAPSSMYSRILTSPARMAMNGLSMQDAEAAAAAHVQRFLGWMGSTQPLMARLRGSFNSRDDKLRQFYFRGEMEQNSALLSNADVARNVAMAHTGPISEAYVGGGS